MPSSSKTERGGRDPFILPRVPAAPAWFKPDLEPLHFELGAFRTMHGTVPGFGPMLIDFAGGPILAARQLLRCYAKADRPERVDMVDGLGACVKRRLRPPTAQELAQKDAMLLTMILYAGIGINSDLAAAIPIALGQVRPAKMLRPALRHIELLRSLASQGIKGEVALEEVHRLTGDSINTIRANRARPFIEALISRTVAPGEVHDPASEWFDGRQELEVALGIAYGLSLGDSNVDDLLWALYVLLLGYANRARRHIPDEAIYALALALGVLTPDGLPRANLGLVHKSVEPRSFMDLCFTNLADYVGKPHFGREHFPEDDLAEETDALWEDLPFYDYVFNVLERRLFNAF